MTGLRHTSYMAMSGWQQSFTGTGDTTDPGQGVEGPLISLDSLLERSWALSLDCPRLDLTAAPQKS